MVRQLRYSIEAMQRQKKREAEEEAEQARMEVHTLPEPNNSQYAHRDILSTFSRWVSDWLAHPFCCLL